MPMSLSELQEQFTIAIAMVSDENEVGCEGKDEVEKWESFLEDAVFNGLEEARNRQTAREFPDGWSPGA